MESGTRFRLLEQLWVLIHLVACTQCIALCWLGFQGRLGRHAPLASAVAADWKKLLCSPTAASRFAPFWSHIREWIACMDPKQFVPLDIGYVVDNVDPLYRGEKHVVFLMILAVARIGDFGRREIRNCMTVQTFLIVIWFCSLGISLGSKLDAIENTWIT